MAVGFRVRCPWFPSARTAHPAASQQEKQRSAFFVIFFEVIFSHSPTFTSGGHVSLVDMQVAVHLASVGFRLAWTRR